MGKWGKASTYEAAYMPNEVYRPNQVDQAALDYLRENWSSQAELVPATFPQPVLEYRLSEGISSDEAIAEVKRLARLCEDNKKTLKLSAQNLTDFELFWKLAETGYFDTITTPDSRRQPLTSIAKEIQRAERNSDDVIIGVDVYRKDEDHQALAKDYSGIPKESQHFTRLTRRTGLYLRQFRIFHQNSPLHLGGIAIHPDLEPTLAVPVLAKLGTTDFVSTSEFARMPREGGRAIPQTQYLLVSRRHMRYGYDTLGDQVFLADDFPATRGLTPAQISSACQEDTWLPSRIRRCKEVWRFQEYESVLAVSPRPPATVSAALAAKLQIYGFR
jgi:hypothetical protein